MQHRPPFGDVDLLAREHRVDTGTDAARAREVEQQPQRLVGHALLGVIEVEAGGLRDEPLAPLRVLREQLTQVDAAHGFVVRGEGLPLGPAREGRHAAQFGLSGRSMRQRAPSHMSTVGASPTNSPVPTTPGSARIVASSARGSAIGLTRQSRM